MIHEKNKKYTIIVTEAYGRSDLGRFTSDGIFLERKYGLIYSVENRPKQVSLELTGQFMTDATYGILNENKLDIKVVRELCGEVLSLWAAKQIAPDYYNKTKHLFKKSSINLVEQERCLEADVNMYALHASQLLKAIACYMYLVLMGRTLEQKKKNLDLLHVHDSFPSPEDLTAMEKSFRSQPKFNEAEWERLKEMALSGGIRTKNLLPWPKNWEPTIKVAA
jgi:hypothetical protein